MKALLAKAGRLTLTGRAAWLCIGIMATAIGWAGWTQWRIGSLHERVGEQRSSVRAMQQVAGVNQAAFEACRSRLIAEIEGRVMDRAAQEAASAEWERRIQAARAESARARVQRQVIYDENNCDSDRPVCSDLADGLRARAGGESTDTRDSGTGDAADTDEADRADPPS